MKQNLFNIIFFSLILISNDILLFGQEASKDKYNYLPESMSTWERAMWGEKGLIRKYIYDPGEPVKEMKLRHNMLQIHQKLGLLTLAMLANQSWMGWELNDGIEVGNRDLNLQKRHRILGMSTFSVYMTAAGFSLFAPPAQKSRKGLYSIKLHKTLAWIHFAGMIAQPFLGIYASDANKYAIFRDNNITGDDLRNMHNTIGMITTVSFSLAFLTTLLP